MIKRSAWLGVAALMVTFASTTAHAGDPLKPYVVLILDTSGSMLQATGSGPPSCGGADNKLNHAKCAINKITNAYGDITFALGTFRQVKGGTTTANTFPTGCCTSGPDVGANGACGDGLACTPADYMLEMLTGLSDGNSDATAKWVDNTGNTCTATGTDPEIWNADSNTPLEGSLNGAKEYWLGAQAAAANGTGDAISVAAGVPTLTDAAGLFNASHRGREITIAGATNGNNNGTFIVTAVLSATQIQYSNGNAVAQANYAGAWTILGATIYPNGSPGFAPITNDPTKDAFLPNGCDPSPTCTSNCCASQCRPYITILLTDGAETCNGNPAAAGVAADALLRTDLGGKRYRVVTKPIGFGIAPGDAQIEGIAHSGGAANGPGNEGFYASDEAGLELAISQILADAVKTETCNNADDDCDLLIDEDFPGKAAMCSNGKQGKCLVNGANVCRTDGTGLACDSGQTACNGHTAGSACNVVNAAGATVIGSCISTPAGLECNPTAAPDEIAGGCNNVDDDCDGKIDEGVSGCNCVPTGEKCDGIDQNCNGMLDDGVGPIPCGVGTCTGTRACVGFAGCNPSPACTGPTCCYGACNNTLPPNYPTEICDGIDNDCNGNADGFSRSCSNLNNGFPALDPKNNPGGTHAPPSGCETEGPSKCICHPGNQTCPLNGAGMFTACLGEVTPQIEICNGLDDDCDGKIDEAPPVTCTNDTQCANSPLTPTCDNPTMMANMGTCVPADCSMGCGTGQLVCVNGMQVCNTTPQANDDTCNGVDDDCDGNIDEDWKCADPAGPDGTIGTADDCPCSNPSVCNGKEMCANGAVVCEGDPVGQEICNCQDDNCNGQVDEGTLCAAGASCTNCQCAFPCSNSEFPCPMGKTCINNFCLADPCFNITCPTVTGDKQLCIPKPGNPNDHVCVSACDPLVINCSAPGTVCFKPTGECKPDDCTTFPDRCAANENCVNGMCISNPCQGINCGTGQYCVGGQCFGSCADVDCPEGQRCRMGACQADPCGHHCPTGQVCHDETGECVSNPCQFVTCPQGQFCDENDNGTCKDDPCVGTTCPNPGEVCKGGTCYDPASFQPDAAMEEHVTTGGGGGCNTSGGEGSGGTFALIALALGALVSRRRRADGGAQ